MTFMSAASLVPCNKDIVTYTLSHANYKDSTKVQLFRQYLFRCTLRADSVLGSNQRFES